MIEKYNFEGYNTDGTIVTAEWGTLITRRWSGYKNGGLTTIVVPIANCYEPEMFLLKEEKIKAPKPE